jgi:hypothetical protein
VSDTLTKGKTMEETPKKRGPKPTYAKSSPAGRGAPKLSARLAPHVLEWIQNQQEGPRTYIERLVEQDIKHRSQKPKILKSAEETLLDAAQLVQDLNSISLEAHSAITHGFALHGLREKIKQRPYEAMALGELAYSQYLRATLRICDLYDSDNKVVTLKGLIRLIEDSVNVLFDKTKRQSAKAECKKIRETIANLQKEDHYKALYQFRNKRAAHTDIEAAKKQESTMEFSTESAKKYVNEAVGIVSACMKLLCEAETADKTLLSKFTPIHRLLDPAGGRYFERLVRLIELGHEKTA